MNKLQILAKRYLDSDIKTLVKAGYLDNSLSVTDDGLEFFAAFGFSQFKKELAALARQTKKEDKEGCEEEEETSEKKKK